MTSASGNFFFRVLRINGGCRGRRTARTKFRWARPTKSRKRNPPKPARRCGRHLRSIISLLCACAHVVLVSSGGCRYRRSGRRNQVSDRRRLRQQYATLTRALLRCDRATYRSLLQCAVILLLAEAIAEVAKASVAGASIVQLCELGDKVDFPFPVAFGSTFPPLGPDVPSGS